MTSLPTLCLAFVAALLTPLTCRAQDLRPGTETMLQREHLGGLKLGLSEKETLKQLGKPEHQGPLTKQEADGTYVPQWSYPAKGLSVLMTSGGKKTGAKSIASFIASPGCTLATANEIKIGSRSPKDAGPCSNS